MRWVGLCGRAGSGKSHAAKGLVMRNSNTVIVSFASALRSEIESVLGVEHAPNLWEKPLKPEVRWLLQQYGTNYRRESDPDYWVRVGKEVALRHQALGMTPIFEDVRFPNEADMIREQGGLIVRVVAEPRERKIRLGMEPPSHASEVAMDNYDVDYEIESSESNPFYHTGLDLIVEAMR